MYFTSCIASRYGGGIYACIAGSGELRLDEVSVSESSAGGGGGALSVSFDSPVGRVVLQDSTCASVPDVEGGFAYFVCPDAIQLLRKRSGSSLFAIMY